MKQFIEFINRARCLNMGNYAPNPNNQDIYNQLATISLNDLTAEQIDNLTNPVKLSSVNQDALITMDIVNKAAKRTGQVMPNKGSIIKYVQTSNDEQAVVRPPSGEVWEIMGISTNCSEAPTGSQSYYFYYSTDATIASNPVPGANNDMFVSSINSASTNLAWEVLSEDFTPRTLIATHDVFPRLYNSFGTMPVGAVCNWIVAYVRRY